jgi:hypothetical protein
MNIVIPNTFEPSAIGVAFLEIWTPNSNSLNRDIAIQCKGKPNSGVKFMEGKSMLRDLEYFTGLRSEFCYK